MRKVHRIECGPYLVVINETNSERGVLPIVNVLRDKKFRSAINADEYVQIWCGDIVEFCDTLENVKTLRR